MTEIKPKYKSYILRLCAVDAAGASWRVRLEGISNANEVYDFADIAGLVDFLLADASPQANPRPPNSLQGGEYSTDDG